MMRILIISVHPKLNPPTEPHPLNPPLPEREISRNSEAKSKVYEQLVKKANISLE